MFHLPGHQDAYISTDPITAWTPFSHNKSRATIPYHTINTMIVTLLHNNRWEQ